MAFELLFTDPFSNYGSDMGNGIKRWTIVQTNVYFDINIGGGRNSTNGLQFKVTSSTYIMAYVLQDVMRCGILGMALRPASGYANTKSFPFQLRYGDTVQVTLYLGSDLKYYLYRGTKEAGTLLASGTTTVSLDLYHYVEFKCFIDNTVGSYELKIDGNTEFSGTNADTQAHASVNTFDRFNLTAPNGVGQVTVDDFYFLGDTADTAGGWLGDCSVEPHYPNVDGTYGDWGYSTGTTYYTLIDEVQPSQTDYAYSSVAADQITVGVDDATGSENVAGVMCWAYSSMGSGGARNAKMLCKSGATLDQGPSQRIRGGASLGKGYLTDPNTGLAWTVTNLNAAEFGMEVV